MIRCLCLHYNKIFTYLSLGTANETMKLIVIAIIIPLTTRHQSIYYYTFRFAPI